MQRAALYIRVSTDGQTEFSPAAQKKILLEYAHKSRMAVSQEHIFVDEGFSGKMAEKRPAFMEMIKTAKQKEKPFDVILIHKFDRFARSRQDSIVYKSLLRKELNIRVISVAENIEDDKMAILVESLLEAMAEYYSINLADEVKKGMTEKAHRGEFQTSPPMGYRMDGSGRLVVVEEEAAYIRYIFEQYVNQHKGCFAIARALNQMGVRSKRGNAMDNRGIQYILGNPVYKGMVRWTPTGKAGRNDDRSDSIIQQGSHEAIIAEELFQQTQEKLHSARERTRRHARPLKECKHWLSGLMVCSDCHRSMILMSVAKYPSFQCGGYSKGQCTVSHSITVKRLEEAISMVFMNMTRGMGDKQYKAAGAVQKDDDMRLETESLGKRLDQLKIQGERANQAYLAAVYSLEEYTAVKRKLDQEKEVIEERINGLIDVTPEQADASCFESIGTVTELLAFDRDMSRKQQAVRNIIEKIVYDKANEHLAVYFRGDLYCDRA